MSRVYETAIKIGASIAKTFKSDTLSAASALTKLTDAAKKLKEAEKAAAAYKRLDDAVSKAKARYDQASASLRRLEEAEKAAGGATKESTAWRKAGTKEVAAAARELDRATKAAEKNGKAMQDLGKLKFAASYQRLFGRRQEDQTPLVQKAGEQFRGVARDVAVLGTAAIGTGAALAGLVLKTLKSADEVGDTADKLRIGSTALQELRYGAAQSGAEVGALDAAIKKMNVSVGHFVMAKGKAGGGGALVIPGLQSLDQAANGAAAAINPFKAIGLDARKLAQLKPEERFKKIADGLAKLKTDAERAATAQAIFGKGTAEILPFLAEGSKGIDQLSKNAHRFGGVLSEDAVKAADAADKAMRDAEYAFAGVANTLGAALLPTATKVFQEFSAWVASNRGEIQKWATSIASWITQKGIPALKEIAIEAQNLGSKVIGLVGGAAKLVGGFDNLAIAVAALRLAPLATTLGKIGVEGFKAAAALLKFAAANRAAKAAEGGGGGGGGSGGGGLLGVLGAGAAALTVERGVENALADTKASSWQGALSLVNGDIGKLNFGNLSAGDVMNFARDPKALAAFMMQQQQQLTASGGGGGGGVNLGGVNVTVGAGASRGDLSNAMDMAKQKALDDYDARLSFAE
jgi:hypothetical protein